MRRPPPCGRQKEAGGEGASESALISERAFTPRDKCEVSRFEHRPERRDADMRDGTGPAPAFSGQKPVNTRHSWNDALRRDEAPPHHPPLVPLAMASITSSASAVLGRRSRSSAIKSARRAAVADGSPKDDRKASASASDDLTALGSSASTRETIQPTHASCVINRIYSMRPGLRAPGFVPRWTRKAAEEGAVAPSSNWVWHTPRPRRPSGLRASHHLAPQTAEARRRPGAIQSQPTFTPKAKASRKITRRLSTGTRAPPSGATSPRSSSGQHVRQWPRHHAECYGSRSVAAERGRRRNSV